MSADNKKVSVDTLTMMSLGFGHTSMFFINRGIWILGLPFYQMTLGVDPFLLSLAASIPLLIATALGPWIGSFVDHSKNTKGTRKPYIVFSAIICSVIYGFIWLVPLNWPQELQFLYLFILSLVFYILSFFLSIPITCLTFESTNSPNQRTKVLAVAAIFVKISALLHQWTFPLTQLAIFSSVVVGVQVIGWIVGIVFIGILGLVPVFFVKESDKVEHYKPSGLSLSKEMKVTLKNHKFLIILIITFLQMGVCAYAATMDFYLIVYYMFAGDIAEGAIWKGVLSTGFAVMGMLTVPIMVKVTNRLGKISALRWVFMLSAFGGLFKWFLFVPGVSWLLVLDAIFCSAIWTAMAITVNAMVADICDNEEKAHRRDMKGLYISVLHLVQQLSGSLALIASGLTLNLIGFDALSGAEQSSSTIMAMRIILALGTLFSGLGAVIALSYYINPPKKLRSQAIEF